MVKYETENGELKMINILIDMDAKDLVTWHCFKHGRVNQSINNHLCLVCGRPMVRTSRYELFTEKDDVVKVEHQKEVIA